MEERKEDIQTYRQESKDRKVKEGRKEGRKAERKVKGGK